MIRDFSREREENRNEWNFFKDSFELDHLNKNLNKIFKYFKKIGGF